MAYVNAWGAHALSSNSIQLEWWASEDADSFNVYKSLSPDGPFEIDGVACNEPGNLVYSYDVQNLLPGTTYYFKVVYCTQGGVEYGESSVASAATVALPCNATVNFTTGFAGLTCGAVSSTRIEITGEGHGEVTDEAVYYALSESGPYTMLSSSVFNPAYPHNGLYSFGTWGDNFSPNTTYYFKAKVTDFQGQAAWSNVKVITTPA